LRNLVTNLVGKDINLIQIDSLDVNKTVADIYNKICRYN